MKSVNSLSFRTLVRAFIALLLFLPTLFVTDAQADAPEVYGKVGNTLVGYQVFGQFGTTNAFVRVVYHDNAIMSGDMLANFVVPFSVLDNDEEASGLTMTHVVLPGCKQFYNKMGTWRFSRGALEIQTSISQSELSNVDCKGGLGVEQVLLKAVFPPINGEDRIAFSLFSKAEKENCKVVSGRSIPLDGIVGRELTVYPNDAAHDVDGYFTGSQLFADMTVNELGQIGPAAWGNAVSYVFLLGDKVTVQGVVKAPRPGDAPAFIRSYLVEVKRTSDGKVGIVDLDQLFDGSLDACSPSILLSRARGRKMPGIFVHLHNDAKPAYLGNHVWVNDPILRYGFCQDFADGVLICSTRDYAKADLKPQSWTVKIDEIDIVKDFPLRGRDFSFRRPA